MQKCPAVQIPETNCEIHPSGNEMRLVVARVHQVRIQEAVDAARVPDQPLVRRPIWKEAHHHMRRARATKLHTQILPLMPFFQKATYLIG